jgi:hypothetical protein
MVLVYLPTQLGDFVRANVGKYSSTMEHMGVITVHIHPMVDPSSITDAAGSSDGCHQPEPTHLVVELFLGRSTAKTAGGHASYEGHAFWGR